MKKTRKLLQKCLIYAVATAVGVGQAYAKKDPETPNYALKKSIQKRSQTISLPDDGYIGESGYSPYRYFSRYNSDMVFVADTGGSLDKYVFKTDLSDGAIKFNIPVSRYFGSTTPEQRLRDLDKMVKLGIIKPKAQLVIMGYDIDNDYQGNDKTPQIDEVYFNGIKLSEPLESGNDKWRTQTYEIDLKNIKFPDVVIGNSIEAMNNEISVKIDVANKSPEWATEIDWAGLVIEGMQPIVLMHGLAGGPSTWEVFSEFLDVTNVPYYLPEQGETDGHGCLKDNANDLKKIIEKAKLSFGVEKINIVSHSRGGVDARLYLRNNSYDLIKSKSLHDNLTNVNALIQLAPPNHGSGLANIRTTSCTKKDLERGRMRDKFNYQRSLVSKKPYASVAWWKFYDYTYMFEPMYNVERKTNIRVGVGDNDWAVNLRSATLPWKAECKDKEGIIIGRCNEGLFMKFRSSHGRSVFSDRILWPITPVIDKLLTDIDHTSFPSWVNWLDLTDPAIHSDAGVYMWTIKQLNELTNSVTYPLYMENLHNNWLASAGSNTDALSLQISQKSLSNTGENRILITDDSLNANETHTITFKVDNTAKLMVNFELGEQSTVSLSDSTGTLHDTFTEANTGYSTMRRYEIANPLAGEWRITLTSANKMNYAVNVSSQANDVALMAKSKKLRYKAGEEVAFAAALNDNGNLIDNLSATIKIRNADRNVTEYTLYDDGTNGDEVANDKFYMVNLGALPAGEYNYSVSAVGGNSQRQYDDWFSVLDNDSVFTDNYSDKLIDSDNDGFYDVLTIDVGVDIKTQLSHPKFTNKA